MKAIILEEYGLPNVLEIGRVSKPIPNDEEVLVRIHSASINDWDWGLVRGKPFVIRLFFGLKKPKIKIPGVDVSGKIEAVGEKVSSFKVGDEISAICRNADVADLPNTFAYQKKTCPKNLPI